MKDDLTPARIIEVGMGFWPAKTLLSAVDLDLFTPMLTVSKRLRCTKCGERKGRGTPEPSNGRPHD